MKKSVQSANGPEPITESTPVPPHVNQEPIENPRTIEHPGKEDASSDFPNSWKPEDLWINPSKVYAAGSVNRPIITIPIRPPNKHEFFRTHPGEGYWHSVALIEMERILYVVHPDMIKHLDEDDIFYA